MKISRLNLLFTKQFLESISLYAIEIFDLYGNNLFTNEIDHIIKDSDIISTTDIGDKILIPIEIKNTISFILRIKFESQEDIKVLLPYANSLKETLESSLNFVNEKSKIRNIEMLDEFLVELLIRDIVDKDSNLYERANLLNFDTTVTRSIVLVDIVHFKQIVLHSSDKSEVQDKLNIVLKILKNSISSFTEHALYLYDDKFVLFKNSNKGLEEELLTIRQTIQKQLSLTTLFIISRPCINLDDYRLEFKKMTEFHEKYARRNLEIPIYHVCDYQIELLLLNMNSEDRSFFLKERKDKLAAILENNRDLAETFICFFKENMDTKRTADIMFIHKNTVYYRIKKLSEILDTDLFKPYNCAFYFIQLCLIQT